jgi:hypothetical protein
VPTVRPLLFVFLHGLGKRKMTTEFWSMKFMADMGADIRTILK